MPLNVPARPFGGSQVSRGHVTSWRAGSGVAQDPAYWTGPFGFRHVRGIGKSVSPVIMGLMGQAVEP